MSALVDEETTTVVLEGLEFEVPCKAGGDHAATVWVHCKACRKNAAPLCDEHCRAKREEAAWKLRHYVVIQCGTCMVIGPSFDSLFAVVPL